MWYAVRQFTFPLLLALALHVAAALALYRGWQPEKTLERVIKPNIVRSELIVLKPKAKPKPKPRAEPAPKIAPPEPKPVEKPPPKVDAEAERQKAAERERLEAERKAEAERERARQERLEALASDAFNQVLEEELEVLADSDDSEAAASYRQGIYERIVRNWSRPPSARNGMEAQVLVELIPTGEVVAVTIVESSGNRAFDQSVEAAVRKARVFDVPPETGLFEDFFRRFSVLFRPEDLLR